MTMLQGTTGSWEMVIGLEVHAQIISNSKLFSGASAQYGGAPNSQVSFVDAGLPGMLPVINSVCVAQAVRTGLGLNAQINLTSVFDRKNYFYPDLPQGYQISQYQQPIVGRGQLLIDLPDGSVKPVGITRLHLEQDAGKSLHDQHPSDSHVDLNRAGVGLMEIVSEPDLRTPDEAGAYLKKLRSILRYLGTCDGNMEEGSLRCDANVSVRRPGEPLGTRCEIKNVNSIRHVQNAIIFEARRQVDLLEAGEKIRQETRLWDTARGETRSMRSKEDAHDYRYFPDPDLLPLVLDPEQVEAWRAELPELPDAKKARFMGHYGLSAYDASVLVAEQAAANFFETVAAGRDGKQAANWVMGELFAVLNDRNLSIEQSPISAGMLGDLLDLLAEQVISGRIAKDVFALMLERGESAREIVAAHGMQQVTDTGAIAAAVAAVLAAHPDKVAEYRAGKEKLFGFFVGQVMKASGGKLNPTALNETLQEQLRG